MSPAASPDVPPEIDALMEKGFALAVQLLGRHDDAADVLQEALRKLVHDPSFNPKRGTRQAWFLKVVRNGALDTIRRRKPQDESLVAELTDRDRTPDHAAEQNELKQIVRRELDGLPQDQREILLLRDFHDLSYAEIAQVMEIRPGTVMSRLHRARTELRNRVRPYL